ncbi:class I SAM-dependent methyltransferase [Evansella sp. LMS18]|jgi:ubiquinone/menaquinone biosynthesis C-methylase UbiE|uniref:class I SAM-dependent DNA methyltransferase n=1 Tax=Evansella sp. LMS18 TaxID=2924033 RepID=UPI0020D171C0|nr:class I SAM-dependent methyltransferase [Evansella sp. LMS18]UTR10470.1 class I SAM-dependent methyltransferase [Evansella sp. LMS18]
MTENKKVSNLEEYNNPALYDYENDGIREDINFLMKHAAATEGTIIELACGTGRVTVPLAEAGFQLAGVDIHKGMLDEAKGKSVNLPITWLEQDCTHLQLTLKSRLIYMAGNSFQHFLTNEDQDKLLKEVNKHLEDEGLFIFDTRFPSADELLAPENQEEHWRTYEDPKEGKRVEVYTITSYDQTSQLQRNTMIRRMMDEDGTVVRERQSDITLRYVFPKEMERLLSSAGFEILESYGNWKETPLTDKSTQMVFVCRKVRGE